MPRTKLGKDKRNEAFQKALRINLAYTDSNQTKLAKKIGVTKETITHWKENPEIMQVKHIRLLIQAKALRIDDLPGIFAD